MLIKLLTRASLWWARCFSHSLLPLKALNRTQIVLYQLNFRAVWVEAVAGWAWLCLCQELLITLKSWWWRLELLKALTANGFWHANLSLTVPLSIKKPIMTFGIPTFRCFLVQMVWSLLFRDMESCETPTRRFWQSQWLHAIVSCKALYCYCCYLLQSESLSESWFLFTGKLKSSGILQAVVGMWAPEWSEGECHNCPSQQQRERASGWLDAGEEARK